MDEPVVVAAEQDQVVEVGGAAVGPVDEVVAVGLAPVSRTDACVLRVVGGAEVAEG